MIEDDEETEETTKAEPRKWSWLWFFSILLAGVKGWFTLCAGILNDIEDSMDEHVDYQRTRKAFEQRASQEIEALTQAVTEAETKVSVGR